MAYASIGYMGPVPSRLSFAKRRTAGLLYVQSLLLHLPHPHFRFAGVCTMGPPGHRRTCPADGAADFRTDDLLLLCRVRRLVPGPVRTALADIENRTCNSRIEV